MTNNKDAGTARPRLGSPPLVALLGALLTVWGLPDLGLDRAAGPVPHRDDDNAQYDQDDPDEQQDVADLVNIES